MNDHKLDDKRVYLEMSLSDISLNINHLQTNRQGAATNKCQFMLQEHHIGLSLPKIASTASLFV